MNANDIENLAAARRTLAKLKARGILTEYSIGPAGVTLSFAEDAPQKMRALWAELGRNFDADSALFASIRGMAR